MTPKAKRTSAPRSSASAHIAKAEQFLRAAERAADQAEYDAVMLNAIHAGISATDAVTIAMAGLRSTDPDHQRAADLLQEVAGASGEIRAQVNQLRRLLSRKNLVEYEARRARAAESSDSLKRASRFVAWARAIVGSST